MTGGIQTVAGLGGGSAGHGIAEVSAIGSYGVVGRDAEEELVDEGSDDIPWSLGKLAVGGMVGQDPDDVHARIDTEVDLTAAVSDADLVFEAAPEKLDLEREIFADLEAYAPDVALLAMSASRLSVTESAAATDRPDQVLGRYFSNPPVKMDRVEAVSGEETSDQTADTGLESESGALGLLASTEDMVEGVRAFREDREPEFEGT